LEKLVIHGGKTLHGNVRVSSAKNAVLPIIVATLLPETPASIVDAPNLDDVFTICSVLESLGVKVKKEDNVLTFDSSLLNKTEASYELMSKMRASFLIMGPLLAKMGHAKIALPGGCMIGSRPIDLHLKAFEAMGAEINIGNGFVESYAPHGLKGTTIYLDFPSVGATENILMAAATAEGRTVIENAAKEPHIVDLANFLNSMGADIMGAGTDVIKVRGVQYLHGTTYSVIPDQIEAGTFMIAAAATHGDVLVKNVIPKHLEPITMKLRKIGVNIEEFDDSVRVWVDGPLVRTNVKTMPHPGFPTDMQPQITTLLTLAEGTSIITEGVWEQRFRYVDELRRMGADISVDGKVAVVEGTGKLTGAPVKACDLRAGAALIIAGLAAKGITEIEDIYHIERGYSCLDEKLRQVGADIQKVSTPVSTLREAL